MNRVALSLFFVLSSSLFASKPNVVLFLADDMGWMDSGVYGSTYYETPNIDRFAKKAMRFTNAYSQPLCSPTRGSILSGQYTARHGITTASGHQPPQPAGHRFLPETAPANAPMLLPESKNYLEPAQITLAETLKSAGYRTAHIGKWHLGLTQPHWPEQQGFDVAFHCHPDPGPPGEYFSPYAVVPEGKPNAKQRVGTITDGPVGEYIVDRQAAEAVKFIQGSKGGPFFLNLWCYGVHGPWGHKEEYTKHFAAKKDPSGRQGNPIMGSMLKSVDECFGRILDELDKQGISDNTIIIFYSDNGGNTHSNISAEGKKSASEDWQKWAGSQPPTMNTPLRDGKGTLYEGGTRVPLMWSWAGKIAQGGTDDAVVGPVDVYPTLIDLLGIAKPEKQTFDGVSYAKVLKGEGDLGRTAYFNYHPHAGANRAGGVWVRSGDFKLLRWFGNPATHELYNLTNDLGEAKDLATTMPEKVKELDALIDGFLKDTGALYPRPNPAYKPVAAKVPAKKTDPLDNWKERGCKATVADGILTMKGTGKGAAFLGHGMAKINGPAVVKLRVRSAAGGAGKIDSLPNTSADPSLVHSTALEVKAGGWQELHVDLKDSGPLGTLRVYLPDSEIDSIEVAPEKGKAQRWDF
ncbi:MAG: sulfatase [Prosthecobacter sp.]|jgi:arylsulfatase A-like enzyme|uniref:sulfatase n=1 Tax=Prosthecobacter sp. TaxID=1965333 RepID=UPI0019E109A5|nr:sulfatase [Prosthecobacter sp.]MBE2283755.1 sulfatase [Prosthecobacter sp.]